MELFLSNRSVDELGSCLHNQTIPSHCENASRLNSPFGGYNSAYQGKGFPQSSFLGDLQFVYLCELAQEADNALIQRMLKTQPTVELHVEVPQTCCNSNTDHFHGNTDPQRCCHSNTNNEYSKAQAWAPCPRSFSPALSTDSGLSEGFSRTTQDLLFLKKLQVCNTAHEQTLPVCSEDDEGIPPSQQLYSQVKKQLVQRRHTLHHLVDKWFEKMMTKVNIADFNTANRGRLPQILLSLDSPLDETLTEAFGTMTVAESQTNEHTSPTAVNTTGNIIVMGKVQCLQKFETRRDDFVRASLPATGLHVTQDGKVIVADLGSDTCQVFNLKNGEICHELDIPPIAEPTSAVALRTVSKQLTYLTAQKDGLYVYSHTGKLIRKILKTDIKCPNCLAVSTDGQVLIVSDKVDAGNIIIIVHMNTETPHNAILSWEYTPASSCFSNAWYICLTKNRTVVLSDKVLHAVKSYTLDGSYLWSWDSPGSQAGHLVQPAGLIEDPFGRILVADVLNHTVQVLSETGEWLCVLISFLMHDICSPMDLALDDEDNLVVLEASGRLSVYKFYFSDIKISEDLHAEDGE